MVNVPNLLTVFRILLVPILVVVLLTKFDGKEFVGLGLFLLAALTDFLDGFLARLKMDEASAAQRDEKIRAEWVVIERNARSAAKKGSRGLQERNYKRALYSKAKELCEKHNITSGELLQILGMDKALEDGQ